MKWIITNEGHLLNLDHVYLVNKSHVDSKKLVYEIEGNAQYIENFDSEKERDKKFDICITKLFKFHQQ